MSIVGWVEQSETQHFLFDGLLGFVPQPNLRSLCFLTLTEPY
jgi:hypothetical protein